MQLSNLVNYFAVPEGLPGYPSLYFTPQSPVMHLTLNQSNPPAGRSRLCSCAYKKCCWRDTKCFCLAGEVTASWAPAPPPCPGDSLLPTSKGTEYGYTCIVWISMPTDGAAEGGAVWGLIFMSGSLC